MKDGAMESDKLFPLTMTMNNDVLVIPGIPLLYTLLTKVNGKISPAEVHCFNLRKLRRIPLERPDFKLEIKVKRVEDPTSPVKALSDIYFERLEVMVNAFNAEVQKISDDFYKEIDGTPSNKYAAGEYLTRSEVEVLIKELRVFDAESRGFGLAN